MPLSAVHKEWVFFPNLIEDLSVVSIYISNKQAGYLNPVGAGFGVWVFEMCGLCERLPGVAFALPPKGKFLRRVLWTSLV